MMVISLYNDTVTHRCCRNGETSIWSRILKAWDFLRTLGGVEMSGKGLQDEGATEGSLEFLGSFQSQSK